VNIVALFAVDPVHVIFP